MSILSQVSSQDNPPAFDRFCDELRTQAATLGTTLLDVRHRLIAKTIGCSAARIHAFMRRLEDRGVIHREPFKNRYLIDVTPLIDQPPSPLIDHPLTPDRSGVIDQGIPDRPIPHQDAPQITPNRDRVKTACMVLHESKIQEEESARDPLFDRLTTEPRMNVPLARRIASHPPGDVADFDADLKIAETFADYPFWFAVDRWKNGQRVLPPEEQHHERPARSDVPAYQRGRSARRASSSHNPTGGAELHNPGWQQKELARIQALYGIADADM